MERQSTKAHRLCLVGISLCLSCLVTEAAARVVGQGPLLMAPRQEAGTRLTPPAGPWELPPVWGANDSKWVRSCVYGFCAGVPSGSSAFLPSTLSSLQLSSWHSSLTSPFSLSNSTLRVPGPNGPWLPGSTKQGTDLLYPCCLLVISPHLPQAQLPPTSALTTPWPSVAWPCSHWPSIAPRPCHLWGELGWCLGLHSSNCLSFSLARSPLSTLVKVPLCH